MCFGRIYSEKSDPAVVYQQCHLICSGWINKFQDQATATSTWLLALERLPGTIKNIFKYYLYMYLQILGHLNKKNWEIIILKGVK